MPNRVF